MRARRVSRSSDKSGRGIFEESDSYILDFGATHHYILEEFGHTVADLTASIGSVDSINDADEEIFRYISMEEVSLRDSFYDNMYDNCSDFVDFSLKIAKSNDAGLVDVKLTRPIRKGLFEMIKEYDVADYSLLGSQWLQIRVKRK